MVVAELKTKVEKYETKASRCEQQARAATDKAAQNFYEVLAGYYGSLATDFRKILEKRLVASTAVARRLDEPAGRANARLTMRAIAPAQ